jgi:hypothetical protein
MDSRTIGNEQATRAILISSTLVGSWLGMQAIHELGHVVAAWSTGGEVSGVVLHPLTISRTDLSHNPAPGIVVWAGPVVGVVAPLALWALAAAAKMSWAFVLRFFAGFCLIANGAYIGLGSFGRVGDCGVMLRHGAEPWQLWLFGMATVPIGFALWHRQGKCFGLGPNAEMFSPLVAYGTFTASVLLFVLGIFVGK